MRVAIAGAGITGLTIAEHLLRDGHRVAVFERDRLGGLAAGFPYPGSPGVYLDNFYHQIFTSDRHLISLIEAHGLGDDLMWNPSRSGLIARGRIWPFGSPWDLLRFAPLGSLRQRLLMGWNLWRLKRTAGPERLHDVRCREFFARRGNLPGYRNLWEPLLRQKFGRRADDTPAAFLWGRIHPRARSRHGGRECLGYLKGGFQRLFLKMADAIRQAGGQIHLGRAVREIRPGPQPQVILDGGLGPQTFDRVVWTASPDRLVRLVPNPPPEVVRKAEAVEYLAATQLILIMPRRQTDYFWLNNIDPAITFGGLIEHTNTAPPEHYAGEHILYVINYHRPGDERFTGRSLDELLDYHAPSLRRVLPEFRRDEILRTYCVRDDYSSPRYDLGYVRRIPPYQGWLPGVDLCSMCQVYPEDRNMGHGVDNARRYLAECLARPAETEIEPLQKAA